MLRRVIAGSLASLALAAGVIAVGETTAPAPAQAALTDSLTTNLPVIKEGSKGVTVTMLQYALLHNGRSVAVDGSFGTATRAAVIAFQKAKGLTADGVVGDNTWDALLSTVQSGAKNNLVKAVQVKLGVTVDGSFGPATKTAVINFQKSKGLAADGIVGGRTWQALLGGSVTTAPKPAPTGSLSNPYPAAKAGNGGWTQRAAWLRDTIKSRFGMSCTTYVSSSPTSDHRTGNAMDCWGTRQQMYDLSRWTAANASSLKVSYVIFEQRIWNLSRSSEGWRLMEDRGSRTANHFDHVHISVQN